MSNEQLEQIVESDSPNIYDEVFDLTAREFAKNSDGDTYPLWFYYRGWQVYVYPDKRHSWLLDWDACDALPDEKCATKIKPVYVLDREYPATVRDACRVAIGYLDKLAEAMTRSGVLAADENPAL